MKKVLYISYDGMTDPLGQSQVIPYLLGLAEKGHNITILSCEKPQNYPALKEAIEKRFAAAGIEWEYVFYSKRPPVLSTVYDLWRMWRTAVKKSKQQRFDIVHCRTILTTILGHGIKKRFGTKLIFDIRGFWADERVDGNLWPLSNPLYSRIYRWFKKKEAQYFTEADHIITLTDNAKNWIQQQTWPGGAVPPIQPIPCAVNLQHFSRQQVDLAASQQFARQLNIEQHHYVLSYLGSLGARYMLPQMMAFFKQLQGEKENALFLFITRDEHDSIFETADAYGIAHACIRVIPSSYQDIPNLLSLVHASIFFIETGELSGRAVSPTKLAELLSMGIPVVCNAGIGDCDSVLEGSGTGVIISEYSETAYTKAVGQLLSLQQKPREEIRQVALSHFSLEMAVENYGKVYDALS